MHEFTYTFDGRPTNHKCDQCGSEKPDAMLRNIPKSQHNPTDDPTKRDPAMLCDACCSTYPGRAWMKEGAERADASA